MTDRSVRQSSKASTTEGSQQQACFQDRSQGLTQNNAAYTVPTGSISSSALRPIRPNIHSIEGRNYHPLTLTTEFHSEAKPGSKRVRVSRACDLCRRKKIKCQDAAPNNSCKNCKSIGVECTFNDSTKKRGPPKGYIEVLEGRLKRMEQLLGNMVEEEPASSQKSPSAPPPSPPLLDLSSAGDNERVLSAPLSPMATSLSPQLPQKQKRTYYPPDQGIIRPNKRLQAVNKSAAEQVRKEEEEEELLIELSSIGSGHQVRYIGDMSPLPLLAQTVNFDDARIASQVGFKIKRFGQSLVIYQKEDSVDRPDSHRVLERIGKLRPGETIRGINDWIYKVTGLDKKTSDTLMKIYFAYIHPSLPLLNKQLFLKQYRSQISEYPSAPLLNAIYGASVRYIETCRIFGDDLALGHSINIKENLSETLFQNVMVYFQGKYNPCISLVQASLISQNHRASMDEKLTGNWALASVAARVAQDIGLHRSSDSWTLPASEKETRKRTWAAVYIMDKWSSAATGRPQSIFDEDCDEFYPSESADWDEVMDVPQEDEDRSDGPRFPSLDEHVAQKVKHGIIPLYQPFVQLLKLSEILGKLLQGLYTPLAKKHSEKYGSDAIVNYLDNALSKWRSALPPALQICSTNVHRLDNHGVTPLISMSAIMYMSYCTLLILLHRPFIEKNGGQKTRSSQSSLSICTSAATQCVAIAEKMHYRDFLLVAWSFAVYPVFTAILIHINNASNPDAYVSDAAKSSLIRARKVLKRLSRISFAATQLHGIVNQLIVNRDITFGKLIKCDEKNPYELPPKWDRAQHEKTHKDSETITPTERDTMRSSLDENNLKVNALNWSDSDVPPSSQSTPNSSVNGDWINGLYSSFQTDRIDPPSLNQISPADTNHVETHPYSLRQFGFNTNATPSYQHVPISYQQSDTSTFNGMEPTMPTNPIDNILPGLFNHFDSLNGVNTQPYPLLNLENDASSIASYMPHSQAQQPSLNNLMDNSSIFRNRPENPFWSVPSSIEMDDWMAYLLQPQQSQSQQVSWQDNPNQPWV